MCHPVFLLTLNMKFTFITLTTLIFFCSCGRFSNTEEEAEHTERIVCISKQYSEIIYALGAQKDIVAVDISSTYPPEIKQLQTVGYHRALSAEGILAARPTLILHDNNIGPEHVVDQINSLHIPMKVFVKGATIDSTEMLIREMGAFFHKEHEADSLCSKLEREIAQATEQAKRFSDSVRVLVIHFGQASNRYFVMTSKSTAAQMIRWAGGTMAIGDTKGMRELSAEVVTQSNPDVILLTDFGFDRLGTPQQVTELPGVAFTNAAIDHRIYRVEEHDLVYLGPRTGENTLMLQKLIHQNTGE